MICETVKLNKKTTEKNQSPSNPVTTTTSQPPLRVICCCALSGQTMLASCCRRWRYGIDLKRSQLHSTTSASIKLLGSLNIISGFTIYAVLIFPSVVYTFFFFLWCLNLGGLVFNRKIEKLVQLSDTSQSGCYGTGYQGSTSLLFIVFV